jgi:hypothetical protein
MKSSPDMFERIGIVALILVLIAIISTIAVNGYYVAPKLNGFDDINFSSSSAQFSNITSVFKEIDPLKGGSVEDINLALNEKAQEICLDLFEKYNVSCTTTPKIFYEENNELSNTFSGYYDNVSNQIFVFKRALNESRLGKEVLKHEIAHYVSDMMSEELVNEDFYPINHANISNEEWAAVDLYYLHLEALENDPSESNVELFKEVLMLEEEIITRYFVSEALAEGIAEYVRTDGKCKRAFEGELPEHIYDLELEELNYLKYFLGQRFVKPILDIDVKRGVEYIIINPPQVESLGEMDKYVRIAAKELSE